MSTFQDKWLRLLLRWSGDGSVAGLICTRLFTHYYKFLLLSSISGHLVVEVFINLLSETFDVVYDLQWSVSRDICIIKTTESINLNFFNNLRSVKWPRRIDSVVDYQRFWEKWESRRFDIFSEAAPIDRYSDIRSKIVWSVVSAQADQKSRSVKHAWQQINRQHSRSSHAVITTSLWKILSKLSKDLYLPYYHIDKASFVYVQHVNPLAHRVNRMTGH